ncbi:MAG TPA: DUF6703 family protein [Streptosporangiaceae bacterium]|nr:DUF6703 family protein [Streptosporangiaceae bacterium]
MSGTNRSAQQRRRPIPPGNSLYTPGASPARQSAERRSAALLVFLHQLPVWVLPVVLVALLVAGLTVAGWIGAVALLAVAAVLGLLAFISWPRLTARGRTGRAAAIACVLAVAVLQAAR